MLNIQALKMAVEISKAIFFLQTQNCHGNFHGHLFSSKHKMAMEISNAIFSSKHKMAMEISKAIFLLTNSKWPWKFPTPFFFCKHKMAMEICKAIFFLQTQNGHGNFQGHFLQRQNGYGNFQGHFFFASTKWLWKFARPFFSYKLKMAMEISKAIFYKLKMAMEISQANVYKRRVYNVVAGGGRGRRRVENYHGHFQHFCVFSAELEILKIQTF